MKLKSAERLSVPRIAAGWLSVVSLLGLAGPTQAAVNLTGNIQFHNDIAWLPFTVVNDTSNVRVWTDSFQEGANFDPITALWDSAGNLLGSNDDDSGIAPGQTHFDSGLRFSFLSAGEYLFSVTTFANFPRGGNLSEGFQYNGEVRIPLAEWDQPANSTGMGSYYSLWVDGEDEILSTPGASQTNPVLPPPLDLGGGGFVFTGITIEDGSLGSPSAPPLWVDPFVTIAYQFQSTSGPLFSQVTMPNLPDADGYGIEFNNAIVANLLAGESFDFTTLDPAGASYFRIVDIDPDLEVDPADPAGFAVGLNFVAVGTPEFTMTPESIFIPEPTTGLLAGIAGSLGLLRRRRLTV